MQSVSLIAAFTAGLISFLSPCVLPLVPGYISMISGTSVDKLQTSNDDDVLRRVLFHSLLFILGFSVVFISLGASASWIGQALLSRMTILYKVAGVIIIIFGLHLTGILKIGLLYRDARFHSAGRPGLGDWCFSDRAGVRIWLDTLHRADSGRHLGTGGKPRIGRARDFPAGNVFCRTGGAVSADQPGRQPLLEILPTLPVAPAPGRSVLRNYSDRARSDDLQQPVYTTGRLSLVSEPLCSVESGRVPP